MLEWLVQSAHERETASAIILQQAGFGGSCCTRSVSSSGILQQFMAVRVVQFGDTQLRIADQTYLEGHAGAVIWDAGLVLAHYLHHSTKAIGDAHEMKAPAHHETACSIPRAHEHGTVVSKPAPCTLHDMQAVSLWLASESSRWVQASIS
jgi:hypothetical protein